MSDRVKNVIVVDDTADNFGGTAQIAYVTCRVLRDRGYNVVYFAGCGPIHKRLEGFNVVMVRDAPFLNSSSKARAALEGLSSRATYKKMSALLSEFNPGDTVIHIHSWTHALSSSVFRAIADSGFKALVTLHEYFLVCPNGGFFDYNRNEICHLMPCSGECLLRNCDKRSYAQKLYRMVRLSLQTKAIAEAKPRFAYLSPFTYEVMRGNRFDDGNPTFLPNPISIEGEPSIGSVSKCGGYLFVGRMDREKNPELFCEALTMLNLPGTLCGDGPELSRLREKYSNLKFKGWCDKEELARQFQVNKALVLTSSWLEASPLVCLEAMFASGIPSIVPDTCGATSYITDGENGLWFKNGDVESLCSAIRKMEDSSSYKGICSRIAEQLPGLRKDRSYEMYAERVTELYEGLYV